MTFFRPIFFFALGFFAAVAIFVGVVIVITSVQNGTITVSYMSGGKTVEETVSRVTDSARFWKQVSLFGGLPVLFGAFGLWLSVRKLKST